MIEMIVKHTNEEGCRRHDQSWAKTDAAKIRRYIGVLLLTGVFRSSNESVFSLWSATDGRPLFQHLMSLRFLRL